MEKEDLIKKFSEVEVKLTEELKKLPVNFSSCGDLKKSEIQGYIKKFSKVKKLFDEYEDLANQIQSQVLEDENLTEEVVDLRESNEEHTTVEVEFESGNIKTKTKKTDGKGKEKI